MLYVRILLCSFLLFLGISGYGQPTKADTIKTLNQNWKIEKLFTHSFKPDEKEELDEFIRTTQMQFNADGSFTTRSDTVIIKGKWQLGGQILTVQTQEGDSFKMKIIELSRNTLVFESRPYGSEKILSAGVMVPVKGIIAPLSAN